jgi:hypothetical protein
MNGGVIHYCTEMEVDRQYIDSHGRRSGRGSSCIPSCTTYMYRSRKRSSRAVSARPPASGVSLRGDHRLMRQNVRELAGVLRLDCVVIVGSELPDTVGKGNELISRTKRPIPVTPIPR